MTRLVSGEPAPAEAPDKALRPLGRNARSIASSLGEVGAALTTRREEAGNSSVWMLMTHYRARVGRPPLAQSRPSPRNKP